MKIFLTMIICLLPISELMTRDISGMYSKELGTVTFAQEESAFTDGYTLSKGRIL